MKGTLKKGLKIDHSSTEKISTYFSGKNICKNSWWNNQKIFGDFLKVILSRIKPLHGFSRSILWKIPEKKKFGEMHNQIIYRVLKNLLSSILTFIIYTILEQYDKSISGRTSGRVIWWNSERSFLPLEKVLKESSKEVLGNIWKKIS